MPQSNGAYALLLIVSLSSLTGIGYYSSVNENGEICMARVTHPANSSTILVQDVVNPLITDYVSQTDTSNQTVTGPFTFVQNRFPFTYIVWLYGGVYYGQSSTGAILSSDASAPVVIQACLDAMTTGGILYFDLDNFNCNAALTVKYSATKLVGKGYGKFEGTDIDGTTLTYWGDITPITIKKADNTMIESVELCGFKIENTGGNKTVPAIYLKDASECTLKQMYLKFSGANAADGVIKIEAVDKWCDENVLDQVTVHGFGTGIGLNLQAGAGTGPGTRWVNVNKFRGCRFFNGATGVKIGGEGGKTGDCDNNEFQSCSPDTNSVVGCYDTGTENTWIGGSFMDFTGAMVPYQNTAAAVNTTLIGVKGLANGAGCTWGGTKIIRGCSGLADV
jgi:hypothetical protein